MTFAEILKSQRRKAGLSQEKLAEKLGVSRQAVTKWETDSGIPEIENIRAVSTLFGISIDGLLSGEAPAKKTADYLFESVTEYDIDGAKRFDMKFGGAKLLSISGWSGEKIRVRLASNTISTLQSDFKVKIDDIKRRIDVDLNRRNGASETQAKEFVFIFVQIPASFAAKIECAASAKSVELRSLSCESIELDVKTANILIEDVFGTVEINCNLDMNIDCKNINGEIDVNQINSTSKIRIPKETKFTAVKKGLATRILYEKDGKPSEKFDTPDSENIIELNGIKSELVISAR